MLTASLVAAHRRARLVAMPTVASDSLVTSRSEVLSRSNGLPSHFRRMRCSVPSSSSSAWATVMRASSAWSASATAIAMFSAEMPRCTTSTSGIGLTSSVSTGASFMNASQPPVVRSASAVRMLP